MALIVIFCLALASDGIRGPVFAIPTEDEVGRVLIRSVQAAFVVGYGTFFVASIAMAVF